MDSLPPYLTVDQFQERLLSESPEKIVDEIVFPGLPFAFRDEPALFDQLRGQLVAKLGVAAANIIVIGSAKLGYSLAPDAYPRGFSSQSDIDVMIVDQDMFDRIWYALLHWHYIRDTSGDMNGYERGWISERRRSIYWGWLQLEDFVFDVGEIVKGRHHLRTLTDLRVRWFNVFKELSSLRELSRRKVDGRLYRSWQHARMYHVDGLNQIISRLRGRR